VAVPENPQVWYPNGTGIDPDVLDCHIKNIFAENVRVTDLAVDCR
jgi:hypothetical protein